MAQLVPKSFVFNFIFLISRIHVKTQSLDIVYNPEAVHWLTDFFTKPLLPATDSNLRTAARKKYQAIKTATKNELIKNWEQILAGDLVSFNNSKLMYYF